MSIINDALKKAQTNMEQQNNPSNPAPQKDVSKIYEKLHQKHSSPQIPGTPGQPSPKSGKGKKEDAKKSPNAVLYILLSLIVIGGSIYTIFFYAGKSTGKSPLEAVKNILPLADDDDKGIETSFKPADPAPFKKYKDGDLVLTGVVGNNNSNAALINGRIYQVGETINGKTISEISMDKVVLTDETGATTELTPKK